MKALTALQALCEGNHLSLVDSPYKVPLARSFDFFDEKPWRSFDVTVMIWHNV